MSDPFRTLTSGDRRPRSARRENALSDLARTAHDGTSDGGDFSFSRDADLIKICNNTNANLAQFSILGIDSPLILPANTGDVATAQFAKWLPFRGIAPLSNTHQGKFVVLQQPLAPNAIGYGAISGVTPAFINTTNASNTAFCEITNNNTVALAPGSSGSAQVLYTNTNAAQPNLSLVRLQAPPPAAVFSGCRVTNSGNQSINSGAGGFISLNFDTEGYDTDGYHSTSVNTDQLVIPVSGKYLCGGYVRWANSAVGARYLQIRDSAGNPVVYASIPSNTFTASGSLMFMTVTMEKDFVAGDYIRLFVAQDSGGALNIEAASGAPVLWIHKVG